jgi:uncharacterized protein
MDPDRRTDSLPVGILLRPIGVPLALGFFGLAGATVVLAGLQLGWIPRSQQVQVGIVLIAFPFPLQLIASIMSFPARDGGTGAAFGTLAATWLAAGLVLIDSPPGTTSGAMGLLFLTSGAALGLMALSTAQSKLVPALVLLLAALRYTTAGIHELSDVRVWEHISAIVGLVLAGTAIYAAAAAELEAMRGQTFLPLGRRRGGAGPAPGASFEDQLERLETEAGVRRRL